MKNKYLLIAALAMVLPKLSVAQFYVDSGGLFYIAGNGELVSEGLVLKPNAGLDLSGLSIRLKDSAVNVAGNMSIVQLYQMNKPLSFAGEIGIFYNSNTLNGNNANVLKIAISPDNNMSFSITLNSINNTNNNFVSGVYSNAVALQQITAVSDGSAVSLQFLNFEAFAKGNTSQLKWIVTDNADGSHFEIERTQNGLDFEKISLQPINIGSAFEQSYIYIDETPINGINLYRIKSVSKDGNSFYSEVRKVLHKADDLTMSIYPNPARQFVNFSLFAEKEFKTELQLFDVSGKLISQSKISPQGGMNQYRIDIEHLSVGVYILKLSEGQSIKLIKE